MRSSLRLSNSPERMTAEVVPSKQCCSWVLATSMIILAAGCSMSISFRMVAPSLVMTTSPIESTSILSMPLGPNVERTASATALAAAMLFDWAVRPRVRCVPSLRIKIGACPFPYMFVSSGIHGEVACVLNPTLSPSSSEERFKLGHSARAIAVRNASIAPSSSLEEGLLRGVGACQPLEEERQQVQLRKGHRKLRYR